MNWYAAAASSTGGTTALRRATARVTAVLIVAALLLRKMDQISAMAPVTNGVAALVPLEVIVPPSESRLVIASPGAMRPRRPIALPRLVMPSGLPRASHAATGITHGWRVIAEPPTVPWLPAAAMTSAARCAA